MRKNILKISIAVLTFSVGLGVFYLWYCQKSISTISCEQKTNELENVFESDVQAENEREDLDIWKLPEGFLPLNKGEFFPVAHACGNGYVSGYLAYDGSHISEGFNPISRRDFDDEIAKVGTITEKFENYPNRDGKKGLRVILQGRNEKTGKDYYSILWFGKWYKIETGRYFIDAPSLKIAQELEKKLINDSRKTKD